MIKSVNDSELSSIIVMLEENSLKTRPLTFIGMIVILIGFVMSLYYVNELRLEMQRKNADLELQVSDLNSKIEQAQRARLQEAAKGSKAMSEVDSLLNDAAQKARAIEKTIAIPNSIPPARLTPRIYIHISTEDQRSPAAQFGTAVVAKRSGFRPIMVPGVQLVEKGADDSLRCFTRDDCAVAAELLERVNARLQSPKLRLADLSKRFGGSKGIRPGHYEVWFDEGPIMLVD